MNNKLILIFLIFIVLGVGCTSDASTTKMDEVTLAKIHESAPVILVPKGDLPEWLIGYLDFLEDGGVYGVPSSAQFYRGKWNGRVVYYIRLAATSCPMCHFHHENGEIMVWTYDGVEAQKFLATSKDWVLIYQTGTYPF